MSVSCLLACLILAATASGSGRWEFVAPALDVVEMRRALCACVQSSFCSRGAGGDDVVEEEEEDNAWSRGISVPSCQWAAVSKEPSMSSLLACRPCVH